MLALFIILVASCEEKEDAHYEYKPALIPLKTIIKNLVFAESSGYHKVRGKVITSHKGAIGRYQITAPALEDYNTFAGKKKKYKTNDLYNLRLNKRVGEWYLKRYIDYYGRRGFDGFDRTVLAINTYNQGHGNTEDGRFYYPYVSNIAPSYYLYFISRRVIKRQGTRIMRLESIQPNKETLL